MVEALSKAQWTEAADADAIASKLASAVEQNLNEAISDIGRASLVVSGGSTPLPFFKALSQANLDWSLVDITLADERWVPEDHEDSNASFVKEHFLVGPASAANFYPMYRDKTPTYAIKEVEQALKSMCHPFSVVILGMGGDGHTASLFPDTQGLESAMDLDSDAMLAVLQPATVPQTRITLTRAALLQSRYRYLHITGQSKRDVLEAALAPDVVNPLPIASFFEKHLPPVSVYWSP